MGKHLRFTADVFNLLDARVDDIAYYYRSALPGDPPPPPGSPPGEYGVHFHPAEPRSFRLAATLVL
ncbi:MAG TPA: hypothetical protein VLU43_14465 [Anaeromyxobacteraceae bacterium]|nr:hypothetical protein [Anaeromyxobacteraceae bacterium]